MDSAAWWGTGTALFLGGLFLDFPDWVYLPFLIGWIASGWMIPAQRERSRQEWENLCATLRAILVSVCVLVLKVTNATCFGMARSATAIRPVIFRASRCQRIVAHRSQWLFVTAPAENFAC